MAIAFLDRTEFTTATTGLMAVSSTIAITAATSPEATISTAAGLTPANAGAIDGPAYTLLVRDGAAWMIVKATYSTANAQFTITSLVRSSTGGFLTLSGNAHVLATISAEDLTQMLPVLPLVNGDLPGPGIMTDGNGQCIGVPLI